MVLDPKNQSLFIFGGQRDEKYLSDMYSYHIPSGVITELYPNFTSIGGPDPCFTQRAVIDPELREIYVCARPFFMHLVGANSAHPDFAVSPDHAPQQRQG